MAARDDARLGRAAELADMRAEGTSQAPTAFTPAVGSSQQTAVQQGTRVSFFFDGTGNNLDADLETQEHSNVARLYRAHLGDDAAQGRFRIYVPGIGTLFREIGDHGGSVTGLAFGGMGEERLEWAMSRLVRACAHGSGIVHVALFGFSRGATLARAFARRIQERCDFQQGTGWYFRGGRRVVRLYFMGLFDTVASVGVPMSTNNEPARGLSLGLLSLSRAMKNRSAFDASLSNIAVGDQPGADPAPGVYDGHQAWASDLRIPAMAERCVHLVAAHEIRNSFPLDSVLQGQRYPAGCVEVVYPGVHSDVGGGYRQGEGARSPTPGSMLSLLPLRDMWNRALQAGVPLLSELRTDAQRRDFGMDVGSDSGFRTLQQRFRHYLSVVGNVGRPLGATVLAHMKLYYQWRFHKIVLNQQARASGRETQDQATLRRNQGPWRSEQQVLAARMEALQTEYRRHLHASMPRRHQMQLTESQKQHMALASQKQAEYLRVKARHDTLPGTDDSLAKNFNIYDDQLVDDALMLQRLAREHGRDKVRPHYLALLEAYEAEFDRKMGLRDTELIAFFDTYVHDSLAGFGQDATLPSDPRVIYIGGDDKLRYAMNDKPGTTRVMTG